MYLLHPTEGKLVQPFDLGHIVPIVLLHQLQPAVGTRWKA